MKVSMGTKMRNLRTYGNRPFNIAVVHGGPGAPGEMAPVARELALDWGVLEPLQTATSLEGQVQELHTVLKESADLPVTLIGWSWGAWLSFILAAQYPSSVRKLILVGSGAYEDRYAANIMSARLSRLNKQERAEVLSLLEILDDPAVGNRNTAMARFGTLIHKADSYDPLPYDGEVLDIQSDIYQNVWKQASELRSSGGLLALGKKVQCPVVAIHGDYDPHLAEGVEDPLSHVLGEFRFILLENCGHHPWYERAARDRFYDILRSEVR